jgi:hypothetical protein
LKPSVKFSALMMVADRVLTVAPTATLDPFTYTLTPPTALDPS